MSTEPGIQVGSRTFRYRAWYERAGGGQPMQFLGLVDAGSVRLRQRDDRLYECGSAEWLRLAGESAP